MSPREKPPSWFTALFVVCWWAGLLTLAFAITGGPWWLTLAVAMLALSGALFGAAAASLSGVVAGVEHVATHDDRPSILTAARSRPLRVLVCGSRDWCLPGPISGRLAAVPRGSVVIHGAASRRPHGVEESADMLADMIARGYGLSVQRFPANWKHYGKAAGIIRNLEMLDTGPDLVLAFQRNGSRGTQHTIDEARRRGIPVEVFTA